MHVNYKVSYNSERWSLQHLSNMHLQRTLLGEYLAASFAHETDVMSTQTVLIQLKLQGKRVVAYATLKRTIAAMICHDVVVLSLRKINRN